MQHARLVRWYVPFFLLLPAYVYVVALQRFYLFDADHAIQIMMAKYFRWESTDFYYWGQNRLGSLIPLLLIVPIKILKLPALVSAVACSSVFYAAALLLLFVNARGAFEKGAALAAFFLLPIGAYRFLLYTGHPYGPSIALTLAAFTLIFRTRPRTVTFFSAGLALSLSCWVSEATLAGIVPICWLMYERRNALQLNSINVGAFVAGLCVLVPFVIYWRHAIGFEGHDAEYVQFATLEMLGRGLGKFLPQFSDMLNSQRSSKPPAAWLAAISLVLVNPLILFGRGWLNERADRVDTPILSFLAAHNACYFLLMLTSRHAYFGEGLIQRYWVPVILYSLFALLVLTARLLEHSAPRAILALAVIASLTTSVGLVTLSVAAWPGLGNGDAFRAIRGHWDDLQEVRRRHARLVTADYWRALPLNVLSEFEILSVPRDFSRTAQFRQQFSRKERKRDRHAFFDFP